MIYIYIKYFFFYTKLVLYNRLVTSNYREILNACYDKKIIYNESNSKCDESKDCVNVLKVMIDIRDWFK